MTMMLARGAGRATASSSPLGVREPSSPLAASRRYADGGSGPAGLVRVSGRLPSSASACSSSISLVPVEDRPRRESSAPRVCEHVMLADSSSSSAAAAPLSKRAPLTVALGEPERRAALAARFAELGWYALVFARQREAGGRPRLASADAALRARLLPARADFDPFFRPCAARAAALPARDRPSVLVQQALDLHQPALSRRRTRQTPRASRVGAQEPRKKRSSAVRQKAPRARSRWRPSTARARLCTTSRRRSQHRNQTSRLLMPT